MGSFSIWHWIILLFILGIAAAIIGLIIWLIVRAAKKPVPVARSAVPEKGMNTVTTTDVVANEYVILCRQGKFEEAIDRFFSADHVRIESLDMAGPPLRVRGIDAVKEKMRASDDDSEIHGAEIDGPYVRENRFAVRFSIDTTFRLTGKRTTIAKMDLYTVEEGKIVRDEVYYNTPPSPSAG